MQIRTRTNTWALIRTQYDKTRKRGVARCLGTVSKAADHLPEELSAMLTAQEREQIESLLRQARSQRDMDRRQHYARMLPVCIDYAAEWYRDPRNEGKHQTDHASDTREAFSRLLAAMVKAGVGRTRKRQSGASKSATRLEPARAKRA